MISSINIVLYFTILPFWRAQGVPEGWCWNSAVQLDHNPKVAQYCPLANRRARIWFEKIYIFGQIRGCTCKHRRRSFWSWRTLQTRWSRPCPLDCTPNTIKVSWTFRRGSRERVTLTKGNPLLLASVAASADLPEFGAPWRCSSEKTSTGT